ncbi:MAG: CRISPR-associated protein Csh1 [Halioglobus sp.]
MHWDLDLVDCGKSKYMIQEIINFVESLPDEVFTNNLKPKEGLYILVDLDEEGNLLNVDGEGRINEEDIGFYSKKDEEMSDLIKRCVPLWMNSVPVSNAKIFNPIKKVFGNTCSPFAFSFNKKNWEKYKDRSVLQKQFIGQEIDNDSLKDKFNEFMLGEMAIYFETASQYVEDDLHKNWMKLFRNYMHNHLIALMENLNEYQEMKSAQGVYVFLKAPTAKDYKIPYQEYLAAKVFNKDDYNKKKESTQEIFGVSDSVSYFNDKKPFLKHKSAPLLYNYRVSEKEAINLWKFFNLLRNKQIPNPIPIFIDQRELNSVAIKVYSSGKEKVGYAELVQLLLKKHKDLSNYYLIFFDVRAKKSKVIDIDFVSNFQYKMNDVKITEVFSLKGSQEAKSRIQNVFDFEYIVINRMFNNQLIPKAGWRRYFDEIEAKRMSNNTYDQLMKYRKSIYDYVFKSRRSAITKPMFDDIMIKGILDDIRSNENITKDYVIKEKLNIWFSLFEYFDYTQFNKSLNQQSMVNKTKEQISRITIIASNDDEHLDSDAQFAFATGQIIRYLFSKSNSGNMTHAMLEPFLQKTDASLLKGEIARCFSMYKHNIKVYPGRYSFDKIMSEVMGYDPEEKNMKKLLPMTLAGYFAKSLFYKKIEN